MDARGHHRRRRPALLRAHPRRLHAPDLALATATAACCSPRAVGVYLGLLVTTLFGAFTAVTFTDPGDSYVADLVAAAPGWYVLPILVIGLAGGVGQGVLNLYASGLDLEALVPRLQRVHTTLITSVAAIVLLFAGTFALDAVDSITAMTLVLNGLAAPWVDRQPPRLPRRAPRALRPASTSRPSTRAAAAAATGSPAAGTCARWSPGRPGSAFGLLAVTTELYTGPLANLAGGVDLSLFGSGLVAAAVYLAALAVWPEHIEEGDLA